RARLRGVHLGSRKLVVSGNFLGSGARAAGLSNLEAVAPTMTSVRVRCATCVATISPRAEMFENDPIVRRLVWPLVLLVSGITPARGEIRPEFDVDHDPEIRIPATIRKFSDRQKPLWLQALARPEADLQRMAAEAVARGHAAGVAGMEEAVP